MPFLTQKKTEKVYKSWLLISFTLFEADFVRKEIVIKSILLNSFTIV